MEFSTLILIALIIALVAWIILGGKISLKPEGIEVDIDGLLKYLAAARRSKGLAESTNPAETASQVKKQVETLQRKLPVATILWVDDHPVNNQNEKMALATLGIFADSYTNNSEALEALATGSYDFVISDVGRDDENEDGWDLLRAIRKRAPNMLFVFYTINIEEDERKRSANMGALGIVERPEDLLNVVIQNLPATHTAHT